MENSQTQIQPGNLNCMFSINKFRLNNTEIMTFLEDFLMRIAHYLEFYFIYMLTKQCLQSSCIFQRKYSCLTVDRIHERVINTI